MMRLRILIVDDEPIMRALIVESLSLGPWDVAEAASGAEALAAITANPPNLVILDRQMPGPDGLAVCRHIKSTPALDKIAIIVLTADPRDEVPARQAGAEYYLVKPFSPKVLLELAQVAIASAPVAIGDSILVADDDPDIREVLATALEFADYRVATANNGMEALAAIEQELPALLLLDIHMPVLDGPGLARKLNDEGIHVPIVVMTSDPAPEYLARNIGAAAYIAKPFAISEVLTRVQETLAQVA